MAVIFEHVRERIRSLRLKFGTLSIRGSVLLKLILAFWVVSILGIVVIAVVADRVSQVEFNRFVNESRYQGLIEQLSQYHAQHGDFRGATYLLEQASSANAGQPREFMVVDNQGKVLISIAEHAPPSLSSPDFTRFGYVINVNGHPVGYLIPLRPPRSPEDSAAANIARIDATLIAGVIFATLVALLFGWVMARNIIRPLRELNAATQSITRGNLENGVKITTRDEIGMLATSFNQMVSSLKHSRDLRLQMTADIAHELRNPLSIILGNAEAMSEGVLQPTSEMLYIIYDEAKHLSRLVDDLRTLSLTESGELHLEITPADVGEMLKHCASLYAVRAAEKGLTMRVEIASTLPLVRIDVERILQVLANLVDNSMKHTSSGGTIILSAGERTPIALEARSASAEESCRSIYIRVSDNGAGIAPVDLPNLFNRFYRGSHPGGRIKDGSGLGLAISKALVELHGGQISVESQAGSGTQFTFCLPVN